MADAVNIIMGAFLTAIFAGIGLVIISNVLDVGGFSIESGLWSLLPILFPFVAVGAILIGIYVYFKG